MLTKLDRDNVPMEEAEACVPNKKPIPVDCPDANRKLWC